MLYEYKSDLEILGLSAILGALFLVCLALASSFSRSTVLASPELLSKTATRVELKH